MDAILQFFSELWATILVICNDIYTSVSLWGIDLWNDVYNTWIADNRWEWIIEGLQNTLFISFFAILLGVVLGIIVALANLSNSKFFKAIANVYVDIIRGTPVLTQILIINSIVFASVNIDKILVAIIAFGINSGAYVSEIIRAGILSVDRGQDEASRSIGLTKGQTMRYIILPQAVKNILPALGNEFIVLIKETSIAGYIGATDLQKASSIATSRTYDALIPLISIAIIYYIIVKLLSTGLKLIEKKMRSADQR